MTAADCTKCGALFGPHSAWKPLAEPVRPTFRRRLRPVFYIYAWLGAAMGVCLLVGGQAEWIAAFIGFAISQPWWPLLSLLLQHEYRSYGYLPVAASAGLNVLILGWLTFGRGSKTGRPMRVDWISLFFRCLLLVMLLGPLLVVMTTQLYSRGQFGSAVAQYVGLLLLGFGEAIVHSALIVLAVYMAARLMGSSLSRSGILGHIALGAGIGFIVGLLRWSLAKKLMLSQPISAYEVVVYALPVSVCGALFLGSAMKTLRTDEQTASRSKDENS